MPRCIAMFPILLLAVTVPSRADNRWLDAPQEEVEVDPIKSAEYNSQGLRRVNGGEYAEAIGDFSKAVRFDPDNAEPRNNRAFLRATCPEARYRNGARAVADATKACELERWKGWSAIDTLAAAYAEKGDFEEAKKWQSKAIKLAKNARAGQGMKARLELYTAGKPYRQAGTN